MKYEKLRDGLIEILNSFDYHYKLYDEEGKAISNPYNARYIYVGRPNMMFIIDESDNKIEFHKANFNFNTFKKILNRVRKLTMEYFINMDVSNYNKEFKPKDFSRDIMRRRYNLEQSLDSISESADVEEKSEPSNITENYAGIKAIYNLNENTIVIDNNIDQITIDSSLNPFVPYLVEKTKKNPDLESVSYTANRITKMKKLHEALDNKAKKCKLSLKDKDLYKKLHRTLNKLN